MQPKGRKFVALIMMSVMTIGYVGVCAVKPALAELMPFMMVIAGVYSAYIIGNVAQKKFQASKK